MVEMNKAMSGKGAIQKINSEVRKGISFLKCRKCGCMKETLGVTLSSLSSIKTDNSGELAKNIRSWIKELRPIEYHCLGCKYCYAAVAMNIFNQTFSQVNKAQPPSCEFKVTKPKWPPVPGEYFAFCEGKVCPVAISTLSSVKLAEDLASLKPKGLCIVGKLETENIGIDKIIKNTITNPSIRFFVVAGKDSEGHFSGNTLLALSRNGVDRNMKVIGSTGRQPILRNVSSLEVETFRKQVQVIDMIGCEDSRRIIAKINEISKEAISTFRQTASLTSVSRIPRILAERPQRLKMDKTGYFVIIPSPDTKTITVEHYGYDNKLLHTIEGKDAPAIYYTIIEKGWITELSHAAYLGRELAKAELSLKYKFKYVQDKAGGKCE
jgi:tetrahydromethanopterin S-methyltransferase subunit A